MLKWTEIVNFIEKIVNKSIKIGLGRCGQRSRKDGQSNPVSTENILNNKERVTHYKLP